MSISLTVMAQQAFDLDTLEKRTFEWFWDNAYASGFQIPDRTPEGQFSSIAATGFGLCGYIIGAERGFISREEAAQRVYQTLKQLFDLPQSKDVVHASGYRGFFYHFLDKETNLRYKNTELSSIDTGLLMAGVLACMTYFDRDEEQRIRLIADKLYKRVEFDWMLNTEGRLSMGWRPERGFIYSDWHGYNEAMILMILALGSPDHSIPSSSWSKWCDTYYTTEFQGYEMINFGPLFGHQYSHAFIDFRGINDNYTQTLGFDYFENSVRATLANRAYCIENPKNYKGYHRNSWGLTACDGPAQDVGTSQMDQSSKYYYNRFFMGYSARGAAADYVVDDGTIAPTAVGGSLPFAPEFCLETLAYLWETHYDSLVGDYGFKDAFNLTADFDGDRPGGWFASDMLGIDQGAMLLMIANHKDELIWNILKKNPYIVKGLKKAGFVGGWLDNSAVFETLSTGEINANTEIPIDAQALFERHTFRHDDNLLPYRWYAPEQKTNGSIPLVIFLHGAGERGKNNRDQLRNGVMALVESSFADENPAYILAPQCPDGHRWSAVKQEWKSANFLDSPSEPMAALMALIDKILSEHEDIDRSRIYICGLSMGAYGGFDLMARRPEIFAAGLMMCGAADLTTVSAFSSIPLSIFHGAMDTVVPVERSREVVSALEALKADVRYIEYTTMGHGIWQETMYNFSNLEWLFKQQNNLVNGK